tara:strand:- start:455 stop:1030 length:576 start_codon:yes stop_codon:yes gene_type:complete
MKQYFIILSILIYGCSSTVPDEYLVELESLKKELKRTKSIARSALNQVHELERKLSKNINVRDSLLIEHRNETLLLRASDAFQKGNNAFFTKKFNKAIEYYLKTIELRPNDAHAYNNLGNSYKEIKNYSKAINAFQNAIILKPDYASAHYNLGIVYQKNKNFEIALDSYRKAARLSHTGIQKWLKDGGYYW